MKKNKVEKQKKHNYKIIIGLLLGLALGSIGVYAATQIASSNVTYRKSGATSDITVNTALDDLFNKTKLQVGSYLYMTPSKTSYSVTSDMTGCISGVTCGSITNGAAQTINPSELNRWIIISKNVDGTYDAVSQYVSSKEVYFYGQTGYQKYIGTLNTIANQYQNSTYTTKARYMGYCNQTEIITDTSALTSTTAPWIQSTTAYPDTTNEPKGFGDIGYMYDYQLVKNIVGTTIAYKVNTTTATIYWLASRLYVYNNIWAYNIPGVGTNGILKSHFIYQYNNKFISNSYGSSIRPIITLKSGIKVTGGSGTSSSPYTISI